MFEIVNSLVKEMKNLRDTMVQTQEQAPVERPQFGGNPTGFPTELFRLFQSGPGMFPSSRIDEEDEDEDEDEDEEQEYKKIVVSDTELDSEDEDEDDDDENNVKVISLAAEPGQSISLDDLEEPVDIDFSEEEEAIVEEPIVEEAPEQTPNEIMDYRKLDVSYLKTMVLTRGLATDTKKMKKSELIRLLEEANKESM
jgi:hypothetical protein